MINITSIIILCIYICITTYTYVNAHALFYYLYTSLLLATVQLNSNLTLACMRLTETQLIFKYTCELAVSAQTSLW